MKVVLTSHRVENLPFIKEEFEKANIIILEEPKNDLLYDAIEGKLEIDEYVRRLDTPFPIYTKKLIEMLRNLKGKEILQIEPYLEEVEKLRTFNSGDERVREMERMVNMTYIDYAESFLKSDFDEIVEKVLRFAQADAERTVMRDRMRADAIEPVDSQVIEAGLMHRKLAEFLDAEVVSIPEMIAEKIRTEYLESPGNMLTQAFINGEECDFNLLAARSLVFVTLLEKKEIVPDFEGDFPHFIHEQKLARFVNRLDYEKCRKVFTKFWTHK